MIAAGGSRAVRYRAKKPVVGDRVQQARRRAIALVPPQPSAVAQAQLPQFGVCRDVKSADLLGFR